MSGLLDALRARRPMVHCITNHVTAGLVANALLAAGASPVMAEGEDEAAAVAAGADTLVINLGTLTPARAAVMRVAVQAARQAGRRWVLDPVAAGGIPSRAVLARALLEARPAIVRGNAGEVASLVPGGGWGLVDAAGAVPVAAARVLADDGTAVAVTGIVDHVSGPGGTWEIRGGHPMMARVSGMGCVASALAAACLTVESDAAAAAVLALTAMARAGEAAGLTAAGPGSFAAAFLDALADC